MGGTRVFLNYTTAASLIISFRLNARAPVRWRRHWRFPTDRCFLGRQRRWCWISLELPWPKTRFFFCWHSSTAKWSDKRRPYVTVIGIFLFAWLMVKFYRIVRGVGDQRQLPVLIMICIVRSSRCPPISVHDAGRRPQHSPASLFGSLNCSVITSFCPCGHFTPLRPIQFPILNNFDICTNQRNFPLDILMQLRFESIMYNIMFLGYLRLQRLGSCPGPEVCRG